MKFVLVALGLLMWLLAGAQGEGGNLFSTVRPDVIVIVTEHPTGAEIVRISVLSGKYSPELLRSQIEEIAQYLGSTARGIRMSKPDLGTVADTSFLQADFATDGLIDRAKGIVRLEPIAKAFAGAPEPYTVRGIKVAFEGERTNKKMLRSYPLKDVLEVQGRASTQPAGIEYQIKLISQDKAQIHIPEEYQNPANQQAAKGTSTSGNQGLLIGLFAVAGVALGALVYLLLLRSGGGRRGS
jgi:hypothetical protein